MSFFVYSIYMVLKIFDNSISVPSKLLSFKMHDVESLLGSNRICSGFMMKFNEMQA
jgi:hypothetical protein